jgi:ABC-type lipoprotein release transport system permease subunit
LIAAGGSLVGLLLGIALALGLELLNNSIRRPVEITSKLGITPLATIPYMRTPMEMVARRAMLTAVFLFIVVGVPTLLYAVHTYYLPLDLIYDRIASRIATIL